MSSFSHDHLQGRLALLSLPESLSSDTQEQTPFKRQIDVSLCKSRTFMKAIICRRNPFTSCHLPKHKKCLYSNKYRYCICKDQSREIDSSFMQHSSLPTHEAELFCLISNKSSPSKPHHNKKREDPLPKYHQTCV